MPTAVPTKPRSTVTSPPTRGSAPSSSSRSASAASVPTSLQVLTPQRTPQKLALLMRLRRFSTPTAVAMVLGILPLYGWSVATQHSWGKRYQHLNELRRDERKYETLTETAKFDITQDAVQNPRGLIPQGPSNNFFLPEMQPRPKVPVVAPSPIQGNSTVSIPLAY